MEFLTCHLSGTSETTPRILIFSIADYSYEVKNSEIEAPAFFKHNNSFIATVSVGLKLGLILDNKKSEN